jgi:hypothetical protein
MGDTDSCETPDADDIYTGLNNPAHQIYVKFAGGLY